MKRRTLLFGSLMLLSGCVTVQPLDSRERAGRFSLRVEGPDGIEAVTGRWKLVEAKGFTELTLMTPLYGILARITVTPDGAVLERPNKEGKEASDSAANALELMRKHLGFGLPADMLSAWLSGIPWPQAPAQIANDAFIQAGWKIAVRRRKTDNSPALVALSQTAPKQITLTLAIE